MTKQTEIIKPKAPITEHISSSLINKTVEWFRVRNLDTGNPLKQYLKFREETEEILYSLRWKKDGSMTEEQIESLKEEFIDGIGDTIVVLVGILTQTAKAKNINPIHIHPALVNDDVNKRMKDHTLKVSDTYTKYRIDFETTYPENSIIHGVDTMRYMVSEFIFDIENKKISDKTLTAIISNILKDFLVMGSIYFEDETLADLTLEDCLLVAYNEIKDRKGLQRDGLYVKEENLTPEELAKLNA